MCWVCDNKSSIAETYWANKLALSAHFAESSGKSTDAFPFDGVGDKLGEPALDLLITVDTVPGDISSAATIEVNGEHVISTIDTIGDEDFFQVEFEAGKTYEIGQYAYIGGPSGIPLSDAFIEIYDAAGNMIVSADGGGPNTPSGLDALLSFTAEEGGTYFINARSYDNAPENGTTGDEVGDYELFVDLAPEGTYVYTPYYDVDSPLYALDWGTQVDGSSRNPDGEEGPRQTGNDFTGAAYNPYGIEGKTVITYYFAKQGDAFISEDPTNPGLDTSVAAGFRDFEIAAFESAMGEFEDVADVAFVEVQDRNEADFIYITYDGTPNVGVLGRMSPPDTQNEGQAEFNRNGPGWNAQNLVKGGFSWVTLTHELGHGMGMAHPHDNGGRSGIMQGVEPEGTAFDYTTGDFDLNQGIFTMMSYEDGWQTSPYGNAPTQSGYGYNGSLAAFDIAVIQDKYGVNEDAATGNDVYRLKDVNASGTYFESIWDADGTDGIVYSGARDTTIDLRAATLRYEDGGGGRVSYAFGVFGGFTVANSVVIENGSTGSGIDDIRGNFVANQFSAGPGDDLMRGADGNDILDGGKGDDTMLGGLDDDHYYVESAGDRVVEAAGAGDDRVNAFIDHVLADHVEELHLYGDANSGTGNFSANRIFGSDGNNALNGLNGNDLLRGREGSDTLRGDTGWDSIHGETGNDSLHGDNGDDDLFGGAGGDTLAGGDGDDQLYGGDDDDSLFGNAGGDVLLGDGGRDVLAGGAGADLFIFDDNDAAAQRSEADRITDFDSAGGDRINLRRIDADVSDAGDDNFTFLGTGTFTGTAGEVRYQVIEGNAFVQGDTNGDGAADFFIRVDDVTTLVATDFMM